jgi:hypothetical protein
MKVNAMIDLQDLFFVEQPAAPEFDYREKVHPFNTRTLAPTTAKQEQKLARIMPEKIRRDFYAYLEALQAKSNGYFSRSLKNIAGDQISFEVGRKFVKVIRTYGDPEHGQSSVVNFVEGSTGLIWKAAGWKQPEMNFPRGNVQNQGTIGVDGWGHYR